jgi:hypothetical protein
MANMCECVKESEFYNVAVSLGYSFLIVYIVCTFNIV